MKISIVTVCFNSAKYISDALRSVDAQTWPDIEHLIIDGKSRDETLQIVANHPKPWRHVVSESDKGIYDAMNKGIRLCQGDVVGFINSDDFYCSPEVLAKVAEVFSDSSIDAVYGDLCYVEQDNIQKVVRYWRSSRFMPGMFRKAWCPPHPTLFVRREVYERLGGFDLQFRIAADMEIMLRLLEVHRINARYLPEVLVHMRLGGTTNKSLSNIAQQNREILHALSMHNQRPSVFGFVIGKFLSRGKQFLTRPE